MEPGSTPSAAAVAQPTGPAPEVAERLERVRTLRRLQKMALVLALGVPIAIGGCLALGSRAGPIARGQEAGATACAFLAMILILLTSRLRGTLLSIGGGAVRSPLLSPASLLLSVYRRATLIAFALLELSAWLGIAVAWFSGSAHYGIVVAGASGLAMATRWPRLGEIERLARRNALTPRV